MLWFVNEKSFLRRSYVPVRRWIAFSTSLVFQSSPSKLWSFSKITFCWTIHPFFSALLLVALLNAECCQLSTVCQMPIHSQSLCDGNFFRRPDVSELCEQQKVFVSIFVYFIEHFDRTENHKRGNKNEIERENVFALARIVDAKCTETFRSATKLCKWNIDERFNQ